MLRKVSDVMIFDVDVLRLGGGHVVDSEGDATPVVLEGGGRAFERTSKTRKKLAKEHGFVGRSNQ